MIAIKAFFASRKDLYSLKLYDLIMQGFAKAWDAAKALEEEKKNMKEDRVCDDGDYTFVEHRNIIETIKGVKKSLIGAVTEQSALRANYYIVEDPDWPATREALTSAVGYMAAGTKTFKFLCLLHFKMPLFW